ncbi:4'-phosphopantetheinyl transferase [Streptomyces sp. NBC_00687]|uniref:4'-phosphopantetheinyl transferase family protein n=1 Tax=Streptomyces sp. NBC_00687 TaxID=2975807 RepID=UPI00224D8597|nr:4'-phosphopantetheinyl transferase superfamily protein [Streptomyces sp. NBC_00687]MCX4918087.1 4'-phosphopantetheinyl transferase superfamily protein [Streptomyces sp. NBC_00687]
MMEELLPEWVVAVESHGDDGTEAAPLYPEEQALLTRAVAKRRREFATVRRCARRAMEKLGVPPAPVLPGERGAPQWPAGLVGSMTHCDGFSAAALARVTDLASLGIDAEPHQSLPPGVLDTIALPAESAGLARLRARTPAVHWDRLLFSAKESVYKAWFPLTGEWLDFSEADIDISVAPTPPGATPSAALTGRFHARLLVPGPVVDGQPVASFDGRWTVKGGLMATAVTVPRAPAR